MLRILPTVLVTSTALAAPALKVKEPATYCAAREGATLEYEQRAGARVTGGFMDVVTKVETKGADLHVSITRSYAVTAPSSSTFAATSEGLFRIAAGNLTLEKPALVLKLPAKVGAEWQDAGQSFRSAAEEEVVVPAGKFKAIRVDSATVGAPVMTQFWYARGIGLLKVSSPISDDQTVLKSFTPGK